MEVRIEPSNCASHICVGFRWRFVLCAFSFYIAKQIGPTVGVGSIVVDK